MAASLARVEFIETSRGGRHLVWNGYRYRQNNRRDSWISWKCILTTCKATLCTRNDILTKFGRDHNHQPNPGAVEGIKIINEVRSRAKVETTPIPSIYDEEITKLRDAPWDSQTREVASQLQTFASSKSSLYRARQKTVPPIPSTRQTIQLSDKFQRTTSGEVFLQADDGDADKILIFATPDNIEHLCAATDIYCDGTFYTAPPMFDSIFTIHAFVGDVMFPLIYALLPKRDTATYLRLFALLKDVATRLNLRLSPTTINLDFESASRNAATQAFPNVQLKGCLFHYTQAIWRKTQALGLQVDYRNQQEVQLLVRRMTALPLLPLPDLDDYWLHAVADAPPRTDCTRLLDYVAETWMEGRLSPETWNHFDTNGPRTNNHLEGWHNKLKKRVGVSHPHIFKIINIFQKEQAANEVKMVQYTAGGTRRKKCRKYREVDEKLSNLKADLRAGRKSCVEYGDAASYLLKC